MRYDYVFVGAGPANLAAANVLLGCGVKNTVILEEGSPLKRRGCPGRSRSFCTHCNGALCHVSGGEGGSSAVFGNKLCYFPASNQVLRYFPEGIIAASARYIDSLLQRFFESQDNCDGNGSTGPSVIVRENSVIVRKDYRTDVLLRGDFEKLICRLLAGPRHADMLRLNTAITEIQRLADFSFKLFTSAGDVLEGNRVVLGCGRSSHEFLRSVLTALGVRWAENCQDIGVRLEGPSEIFTRKFKYQGDPKYKVAHSTSGTSRTFCGCDGGIIVPVKFGKSYYADGAFGDEFTGRSNLAFMVRSQKPIPTSELEKWCAGINASAGGSLLLGEVPLHGGDMRRLVGAMVAMVPKWPSDHHRAMISELLTLALGDGISLLRRQGTGSASVRVFGPAIDLYWPRPELARGLGTDVPGLYVLGDATGISRGFVQAMVSGAAWALTQLSESTLHGAGSLISKGVDKWCVSA